MSSYDKLIKQATKPKPGAPKPKYIDPIIASSFSKDGSLQDICRALAGRLTDSSSLVVFRSLVVVHTLIRNGGVDNVLQHLTSSRGSLRFNNVAQGGNWQGFDAPRMLSPYATYLEERVKAYRELRHDVIRASDASRTRSGSNSGDRSEGKESGQRLRRLTVEKGLLREVHVCQRVCSRLLDLFFAYFSDNVHDELALTAFRMSLKDLLAIYAAINEGVINVLEHYFEMSKVDATHALDVYKRFCAHTEKIVAYLASARKVSHSLNVPIPNLRHAPVSLAGALKEYLEDPNFERNRQEYKENKRVADGRASPSTSKKAEEKQQAVPASTSKTSVTFQEPTAEQKTKPVKPPTENQALQDFFESIETDQMSMFGPNAQQQGFIMPQATGYPVMGGGMAPQMTGYNPFFGQQLQPSGFMMQPQLTGFAPGGFLGPQMTGANPFRQSVMMQPTGMGQPFGQFGQQQQQQTTSADAATNFFGGSTNGMAASPQPVAGRALSPPPSFVALQQQQQPERSASVPLPKALQAQKTGSRNPFAPPPGSTPPPPKSPPGSKGPTLFELAFGGAAAGTQGPTQGGGGSYGLGANAWSGDAGQGQPQQPQASLMPQKTGLIGSIASEFAFGNAVGQSASSGTQSPAVQPSTPGVAANGLSSSFAGLSVGGQQQQPQQQPQQQQTTAAPLQPQATGFGGSLVQPFKPESSFGMTLSAGGGVSQPGVIPPNMTGNPFARMNSASPLAAKTMPSNGVVPSAATTTTTTLGAQPTGFGSSLFGGTPSNGGATSPFAFTNGNATGAQTPSFFTNGSTPAAVAPQPTGFAGSTVKPFQPSSAFGAAAFGQPSPAQAQPQPQQQPAATGSLFTF